MKKLIIFALTACLICSCALLAGCDGVPGYEVAATWDDAFTKDDLKNITLGYEVTFISGYDDAGPHTNQLKMVDGKMYMGGNEVTDEDTIASMENVFLGMTKCIIDNKSSFQFNSKNNNYTCDKTISCDVEALIYTATLSMSDLVVTFDANGKLTSFSCQMVQDVTSTDPAAASDLQLTLTATFTFSDYGTTKAN